MRTKKKLLYIYIYIYIYTNKIHKISCLSFLQITYFLKLHIIYYINNICYLRIYEKLKHPTI